VQRASPPGKPSSRCAISASVTPPRMSALHLRPLARRTRGSATKTSFGIKASGDRVAAVSFVSGQRGRRVRCRGSDRRERGVASAPPRWRPPARSEPATCHDCRRGPGAPPGCLRHREQSSLDRRSVDAGCGSPAPRPPCIVLGTSSSRDIHSTHWVLPSQVVPKRPRVEAVVWTGYSRL
jgi:hypothetical protein